MNALLRSPRFWGYAGAFASLLLALWFIWGVVVVILWRQEAYGVSRVPISPWPLINAVVFLALAVAGLRQSERARPWMLGGGVVTMFLSAGAARVNPWDWAAVVMGALLALCAWMWERAVRRSAAPARD